MEDKISEVESELHEASEEMRKVPVETGLLTLPESFWMERRCLEPEALKVKLDRIAEKEERLQCEKSRQIRRSVSRASKTIWTCACLRTNKVELSFILVDGIHPIFRVTGSAGRKVSSTCCWFLCGCVAHTHMFDVHTMRWSTNCVQLRGTVDDDGRSSKLLCGIQRNCSASLCIAELNDFF